MKYKTSIAAYMFCLHVVFLPSRHSVASGWPQLAHKIQRDSPSVILALNQYGPPYDTDNHSLLSFYDDTRDIKLCHRGAACTQEREREMEDK